MIKSSHTYSLKVIEIKGIIIHTSLSETELKSQMQHVGVDPRGIEIMVDKFQHYLVRIFGVNPRQAAIIKQEMLARGADAAVSWRVCTMEYQENESDNSLLLAGTLRQLRQFCRKLKMQPFRLPELANQIEIALQNYQGPNSQILKIGTDCYDLSKKALVMGIINITPDSFSQDGLYQDSNFIEKALRQGEKMIADGAELLDIGAESTRPGAAYVGEEEEERRLLPVIKELAAAFKIPISVDTYKPGIAEKALNCGAKIINDIWGLKSPEDPEHRMAKLVADSKAPVIIMHNQAQPGYQHLMREVIDSLAESIEIARTAGAEVGQIIVDPGIGFGKTYQDNLAVMNQLELLKILGCPILLGTSRKSMIGVALDLPVEERLEGTLATVVWGIAKGVGIVRVHDVQAAVRAVKMCDAIRNPI